MAWEVVATGTVSSDGLGSIQKTLEELPIGTKGRILLEAPWYFPIGPLFDAAGVEQLAQGYFNVSGADITVLDCRGEGASKGIIEFQGSPVALLAVLAALPPILGALAILGVIVLLTVLIWKAVTTPQGFLTLVLVGALVIGGMYLMRRK